MPSLSWSTLIECLQSATTRGQDRDELSATDLVTELRFLNMMRLTVLSALTKEADTLPAPHLTALLEAWSRTTYQARKLITAYLHATAEEDHQLRDLLGLDPDDERIRLSQD